MNLEEELNDLDGRDADKQIALIRDELSALIAAYQALFVAACVMTAGAITGSVIAPPLAALLMIWRGAGLLNAPADLKVHYKRLLLLALVPAAIAAIPIMGGEVLAHAGDALCAAGLWFQVKKGAGSTNRAALRQAYINVSVDV